MQKTASQNIFSLPRFQALSFSIVTSFWARSQKRHIWNDVRLRRYVHHFLTECKNYLIIWTFKDQDHYLWNLKLKMYFFKFWHYDVITGTDVKFLKCVKPKILALPFTKTWWKLDYTLTTRWATHLYCG